VSFDIIGLSYYPFWDAPLSALATNLQQLASRYHKPLLIVETAYAHDLKDATTPPIPLVRHKSSKAAIRQPLKAS